MRRARVPRRPPLERSYERTCGIRLHSAQGHRHENAARTAPGTACGSGRRASGDSARRGRTMALAAAHPEDVEALGVDGGRVCLPAQVDELAHEPLDLLVQALADGAARENPLQSCSSVAMCSRSTGRTRTFGTAATASLRGLAMLPDSAHGLIAKIFVVGRCWQKPGSEGRIWHAAGRIRGGRAEPSAAYVYNRKHPIWSKTDSSA